ncbi:PKD domain-containing protein [Actinoplanes sp. NPDC023714]|uniref:PKD domain-containing protein n=1 Tax=Actinoplanes sp. NPDC023714 TaxID=3154322 RepID=UPI0033F1EDDE
MSAKVARRRFHRFAVLPALLALSATAIVALPSSPAAAVDDPPTSAGVELTDLGVLSHGGGIRAMNNRGQVVGGVWTPDGQHIVPTLFERGGQTSLAESFPEDLHDGYALDITDDGVVLGEADYKKEKQAFLWENGQVEFLDSGWPGAVNKKRQTAGTSYVREPNGEKMVLSGSYAWEFGVMDMNDAGQVVGMGDITDDKERNLRAFRSRPGMPLDPYKDLLQWAGEGTSAGGINQKGEVAGYAVDPTGGYVPVIWDAEGRPRSPITPQGGTANGINNAGTAVGKFFLVDGKTRAALFQDGTYTDLNTLLPAGSGWTLTEAVAINDVGQIAGIGRPAGAEFDHAFLMDLAPQGPVIESVTLETQSYPSPAWNPVTESGTVDGNRVRISVKLRNRSDWFIFTQLQLTEKVSGKKLPGGTLDVILNPGETTFERVEWDTAGFAWKNGDQPGSDRTIEAKLVSGGVVKDSRSAPIVVRPKPVILTHGYKSNAEASWGKYAPILAKGHPLLKGYAVGDGQAPGVLKTGDMFRPLMPTNTLLQNATEQAVYIDGIRKVTGAYHVDIVAHSMGGLISRQYIQEDMPPSLDDKPVVNRLIQLGTPNMGSPCADFLLDLPGSDTYRIPDIAPYMPATLQLTPKYMTGVFNQEITNLRGVPVSNMVGHGHRVPCFPFPDGDIVVPIPSAQYIYQDIPWTGIDHLEMTESADEFENYVKPRLASLSAGAYEPAKKKAAAAAPAGDSATTFAVPAATVAAGDSKTLTFEVPEGEAFGVTAALPPTVGVTLKKPDGTVASGYEPQSAEARQPIQTLSVTNQVTGTWTIEVTNTGAEEIPAAFAAWVAGNPVTIKADAKADDTGRATITATVSGAAGSNATATLLDAKKQRTDLTLTDEGDGVFRVVTDALPDGDYSATVRADTAAGKRITHTTIHVQRPDTREFKLDVTPQPGGTVAVDPQQPVYRAGTTVTLTAKAEAGRMPLGWTVDGVAKPAGALTLTMDRDHEVVAKFGRYAVEELGALPGGWAMNTVANDLNDRGQVAATVVTGAGSGTGTDQRRRAVRWEDGTFTELDRLPCDEAKGPCGSYGAGINEAGDVVGSASVGDGSINVSHATVWSGGAVKDLHDESVRGRDSAAEAINDKGQIAGSVTPYNSNVSNVILWSDGSVKRTPESPKFWTSDYRRPAGRMNDRGTVVGGYVTASDFSGPYRWMPAMYANGQVTKLPVPECGPGWESGVASGVNHRGDIAGTYLCNNGDTVRENGYVWKDGERVDLGPGEATAINNSGLVAGFAGSDNSRKPVLWLDGVQYQLADLLAQRLCGAGVSGPCLTIDTLVDVNSSGQLLAMGSTTELRADGRVTKEARSFLLDPTSSSADLRVDHAVSHLTPAPGQTVTWTTTVTNSGPDTATGVRATVTLPSQVSIKECETTRGACKTVDGAARLTVSSLPEDATATVTVTGQVTAGTKENEKLVSTAEAISVAVPDPQLADNTASVTATAMEALDRKEIAFGDPVRVGQAAWPVPVTLTNRQPTAMKLLAIETTGPFRQTNACPELKPGDKCTVEVSFAPTEVGPATGELRFITEEGAAPAFTVKLSGKGIEPNNRPVIKIPEEIQKAAAGQPLKLEIPFTDEDADDTHTALISWNGMQDEKADMEQGRGGGTIRINRTFPEAEEGIVVLTVTDSKRDSTVDVFWYEITAAGTNTAPEITAGPDAELTAGERFQRTVTFTDPTSESWTATADYGDGTVRDLKPNERELTLDHTWAQPGAYPVTVTVRDDGGLTSTAKFTVTVVPAQTPNTAPTVEFTGSASLTEGGTWTATGTITDPDDDVWTATADFGDGSGPQPVRLDGRSFALSHVFTDDGARTVEVRVTDDKGGNAVATRLVKVANAAPAVTLTAPAAGAVVAVGAPVRLEASFTDAGAADTHTAKWEIGTKTYESGAAGGTATLPHVFTKAGRYPITVTVADDDGGKATKESYVLVYDTATAIVGAGVTASPAGSCTIDKACGHASAATFALHAAYPRKSTLPTGELRFTAAGIDLRGTSFTVLAAADGKAVLRGAGTANGAEVTFEVTATDSKRPLDRTDSLRLVVTSRSGQVIYDNQRGGTKNPVLGVVRISD